MATAWLLPLLASLVGATFAARVWGQWWVRRRGHQLAWAVGLTLYALAALLDAIVAEQGWSVPTYRVYFVVAAANVGLLGLGTVLLLKRGWWTRAFGAFAVAAILVAAVAPLSVPLAADTPITLETEGVSETRPLQEWGTGLGAKPIPFPNAGRFAFLLLNVVGGLALIGGAILSWRQTRRPGVLLIGLGAMMPFLGGSLSTLYALDWRTLLQFAGIAVMFFGYTRSRESPRPPAPEAAPANP